MADWKIYADGPLVCIEVTQEVGKRSFAAFSVTDGLFWAVETCNTIQDTKRCLLLVKPSCSTGEPFEVREEWVPRGDDFKLETTMRAAYMEAYSYAYRSGA